MNIDSVTQTAFLCASLISGIVTILLAIHIRKKNLHWSIICAGTLQTFWLFAVGTSISFQLSLGFLMILEAAHFTSWIFAAILTAQFFCKTCIPKHYKNFCYALGCATLLFDSLAYFYDPRSAAILPILTTQGLIFAIVALLSVEQLYRNVQDIRAIKIICINLAAIFIYDVYFFSQSLVQPELSSGFYQIRATIIFVASLFIGVATITLPNNPSQPARLSLSRPVVFYTTSLTIAGTLLATIALGGYYVKEIGGQWGELAYTTLLLTSLSSLLVLFTSKASRKKLSVLIDKHLFSHKYDYRTEWLKLIDRLSQPASSEEAHKQALSAVAGIFKSSGGALWMHKGKVLAPVYQSNISFNILECIEPDDSPFIQALQRSEWVFLPGNNSHENRALTQNNELVPEWAQKVNDVWLILPLLNESDLVGFMLLTGAQNSQTLNWEDLDLLKTVGRQIATYLQRHDQAEQLAEARQFEAFNKLAAYVMHDLKNLIAQQSLVVKNAEKHKDNPAFIEDAIQTINNSVTRMNNLLRKLQRNEADTVRVLTLNDTLLEAVRRCQKGQPVPTLRNEHTDIRVKGDFDSLVMVIVHIVQNAQDATSPNGFIDISIEKDEHLVYITIEDNGEGMDPAFIRDRLFKPFDTTKTGKGMGIGVYQARDYIQALGGNLSVESTPTEGTTFTISIPITGS